VLELAEAEKYTISQKFDYLKDNTKYNKTTNNESFILVRSGENVG